MVRFFVLSSREMGVGKKKKKREFPVSFQEVEELCVVTGCKALTQVWSGEISHAEAHG